MVLCGADCTGCGAARVPRVVPAQEVCEEGRGPAPPAVRGSRACAQGAPPEELPRRRQPGRLLHGARVHCPPLHRTPFRRGYPGCDRRRTQAAYVACGGPSAGLQGIGRDARRRDRAGEVCEDEARGRTLPLLGRMGRPPARGYQAYSGRRTGQERGSQSRCRRCSRSA